MGLGRRAGVYKKGFAISYATKALAVLKILAAENAAPPSTAEAGIKESYQESEYAFASGKARLYRPYVRLN